MGLIKTTTLQSGAVIQDAYYRVDSFQGRINYANIKLAVYISRDAFTTNKQPLMYAEYTVPLDSSDDAPNIIRQTYAHLKTIDTYQDAINVLEDGQKPL